MHHLGRWRKVLAGVLACAILAAPQTLSYSTAADTSSLASQEDQLLQQKGELDQKERELNARQAELEQKLEEIRQDKSRQLEYRNTLEEQMEVLKEQIRNTEKQISRLDQEIEEKSAQIAETERQIKTDMEFLKKRLRAIYMAGEASTLDILLGATDVNDFLDKAMILQRVSQRDTQLIEGLKTSVNSISAEREAIQDNREQVMGSKQKLDAQKKDLDALQQECNQVIQELEGQEGEARGQQEEAAKEKEQFDEELSRWHKEYVANQRAQQEAASSSQPSSQPSSGSSSSSKPSDSSSSPSSRPSEESPKPPEESSKPEPDPEPQPPATGAKYLWPLPGFTTITSYFGNRPQYGYHRGIDIAGANVYRAKIVSAEDGVVIRVNRTDSWGSGWGYYVMIDHGDGYATQYAHCDEILVNVGDTVKRGDPIALVGDTGDSYGAHLHFEVWDNGTRIDPLPFLKG